MNCVIKINHNSFNQSRFVCVVIFYSNKMLLEALLEDQFNV